MTITTAGHSVEIESDETGMNVHRLANIAVNTWRRTRTSDIAKAWGTSSAQVEQQYREPGEVAFGFDPMEAR